MKVFRSGLLFTALFLTLFTLYEILTIDLKYGVVHDATGGINYLNNATKDFINGQKIFNMTKSENFSHCLPLFNSPTESTRIKWSIYPRQCDQGVSIVWLIKSSIYRSALRRTLRRTWAKEINSSFGSVRRIFIMGSMSDVKTIPLIKYESEVEKDILQGSFQDTFRGVTIKVLMGLQFIKLYCSNVKKVIIADDDAMVLPWQLFPLLNLNAKDERDVIDYGGFITYVSKVVRRKKHRYYVSKQEYSCSKYPPYPLGTVFALSVKAVTMFHDLSHVVKPFVWDDVYLGILAEIANLSKTNLAGIHEYYCEDISFSAHGVESLPNITACHGTDTVWEHLGLWNEFCYSYVSPELQQLLLTYCRERLSDLT